MKYGKICGYDIGLYYLIRPPGTLVQEGLRFYPKSKNVLFESDSSRVLRKKSVELWSTNYRELDVSLDPPKLHYSGDYISALRGCWPLKF